MALTSPELRLMIKTEWAALAKLKLPALKRMVQQSYRVIDVSGMDKASAVSHLMTAKYGAKTIRETFYGPEA